MKIEKPTSRQPIPESAKLVFKGVIFDVYQWEQELFDGRRVMFEKLKALDSVLIIPVTEDGKIMLSRQEQPGKAPYVGTVGGGVEEGEEVIDAAKRELLEETGCQAKEWRLLHASQPMSKIERAVYILVAKGCVKVAEQELDGGEKIDLMPVAFDEYINVAASQNFGDVELRIMALEAKLDSSKMVFLKSLLTE